jgi:enolase
MSRNDTAIVGVAGRRIWTAGGAPALEVDIHLGCGVRGRATSLPAGGAWQQFGDGSQRQAEASCRATPIAAIESINGLFAGALRGIDAVCQDDIDAALLRLEIGGDASVTRAARSACSIAAAQAAARTAGVPLFRYLRAGSPARMPMPMVEVATATSAASPYRALAVVPFAADGVDEALAVAIAIQRRAAELMHGAPALVDDETIGSVFEAIARAGFVPAEEIGVALDVGATRIHREEGYACPEGTLSGDDWRARLVRTVEAYPLCSIEDPFAAAEHLSELAPLIHHRTRIVGDELFASDAERIAAAIDRGIASAVTLRPESAGTLSELRLAFNAARRGAWPVLAAADPAGEDASLAHIATAWQASYIKLGALGRGSLARGNELLRIEAALQPAPAPLHIEAAARLVH